MNQVQRFRTVMNFQSADRLPTIEWAAYWDKTVNQWHQQGLPQEVDAAYDVRRFFGLDSYQQWWVSPRSVDCPAPAHHGAALIKDQKDYQEIKKYLYPTQPFDESTMAQWAAEQKKGDTVIWITLEGFFWFPRTLFGIEGHMYAFYDQADLMHRINQDMADYHRYVLEKLYPICVPDFMTFAEDMSYNNGPMLSQEAFEQFLKPYYDQVVPVLKKRGVLPLVDSDGDVTKLIPWLESVGVEGILPLERMAKVDVAKIRRDHPRFRMIGGFDKTVMHLGEAAMRGEFERLLPTMRQGGFIPSVDHQTPPDVSIQNYRSYIELLREYCQKAAQ